MQTRWRGVFEDDHLEAHSPEGHNCSGEVVIDIGAGVGIGSWAKPNAVPRLTDRPSETTPATSTTTTIKHGGSLKGASHGRRNCAYCPVVLDLKDGDDVGPSYPDRCWLFWGLS
jgi:hypothetical protein